MGVKASKQSVNISSTPKKAGLAEANGKAVDDKVVVEKVEDKPTNGEVKAVEDTNGDAKKEVEEVKAEDGEDKKESEDGEKGEEAKEGEDDADKTTGMWSVIIFGVTHDIPSLSLGSPKEKCSIINSVSGVKILPGDRSMRGTE